MTDFNDPTWKAVDAAAARLENAWKQGPDPDLGQFLPSLDDPMRERVLVELVKVDQEHRWKTGSPKKVEDYLRAWRELKAKPEIVVELLVAECLAQAAAGGLPSQTGAIPGGSGPEATLSRKEQILRHPVCGPLLRKAAEEQDLLARDMLADEPAAGRVVTFHKATLHRLLERLPALPVGPIACGPGCAFCCHLKVEVHAYEALGIAGFLREHRTPEELAVLIEALRQRVRQVRKLTPGAQTHANLRCLFLDETDRCTIYARRPIHCIGVTSRSREVCQAAFQSDKGWSRIAVDMAIMACTQGVMSGVALAMRELGLEAGYHELNAAVLTALEAPEAAHRWLRGEKVFSSLPPAARSQRAAQPRAGSPSRNAPCPCGSGKKYKQCCLRKSPNS